MMRWSLFLLGGFLFYDMEASGDSRGADSVCRGDCIVGLDGDCCDSSSLVTLLALFEYFALGEAIGHRAYRFWTAICALLLIYVQWLMGDVPTYKLSGGLIASQRIPWLANGLPRWKRCSF